MIPELTEIKGFNGYYISEDGRIFSSRKSNTLNEMILKEDKDGYLEVGLYADGKRFFRRVHRLVAQTYLINSNNYPQVNHIDGNVKNNHISNLEWCTCQENMIHSFRVLKRNPSITTNKKVSLTHKYTQEVLQFNSIKDLARYLKMSHEHLSKVINGTCDIKKCKKLKPFTVTLL